MLECLQSIQSHVELDEIKNLHLKSQEELSKITCSYEYIGLKLLYICKLFIKGERFPEGLLSKKAHLQYLAQCMDFITQREIAIEVIQVNTRSFFLVASDFFLGSALTLLIESNKEQEDQLSPHEGITLKLKEIVDVLDHIKHIRFEY